MSGGPEPRGGVPLAVGGRHHRLGHRRSGLGHHGGRLRRAGRWHRLERHHLVPRHAVEFVPRPHRWGDRRRAGARRRERDHLVRRRRQGVHPRHLRPDLRRDRGRAWERCWPTGSPSKAKDEVKTRSFRVGQIGTAALVSLAHGTNDAQKTMGVLTLALIANKTDPGRVVDPRVGHHPVRHLHQPGDVPRWVAHHPHPGQGPHRNPDPAGLRRRSLVLRRHSGLDPLRHPAVHHPGHQRVGRRGRRRASPTGAVERLPPHGLHLVRHPAGGRPGRGRRLLPAELDRRLARGGRPRSSCWPCTAPVSTGCPARAP